MKSRTPQTNSEIPLSELENLANIQSANIQPTNVEFDNQSRTAAQNPSDFSIIWHNLSYKVESGSLRNKLSSLFGRQDEQRSSDLDSSIPSNGTKKKTIIDKACGRVGSRQLTAIMGPSGAGKSTLLNCLFQNRRDGTSGRILVDSKNRSKFKICFIPQHDYLNEWLTVREDLVFVSKLRQTKLGANIDRKDGDESVNVDNNSYVKQSGKNCRTSLIDHEATAVHVANLLGLGTCLDVHVKNISGGQKKRLSIARELMSRPDVLVLDEPTTGLDSLTCYKTVLALKDLIRNSPHPMAVVVTIHQPQRNVFNLFDKAYVMSKRGYVIFDGNPRDAAQVIEKVGGVQMPSPNYNPATFLIELASDTSHSDVIDRLAAHQRGEFFKNQSTSYLDGLAQSKHQNNHTEISIPKPTLAEKASMTNDSAINIVSESSSREVSQNSDVSTHDLTATNETAGSKPVEEAETDSSGYNQYYISHQLSNCLSSHSISLLQSCQHTLILTHRSWLSITRNPSFTRSRFVFHIAFPFITLFMFGSKIGNPNVCPKYDAELDMTQMANDIGSGTISNNLNEVRLGLENVSLFFVMMYGFGINLISCTASFYPLTMHMFKKETINGLYSAGPYFLGQMIAELPLEFILPTISILIVFPLSGQIPSFMEWRMFTAAYVVFLVCYCIHALGLLCGSIFINNINIAVLAGQTVLLPYILLSGFLIRPNRMPPWMLYTSYLSPFKHGLNGFVVARYGFNVCDCDEEIFDDPDHRYAVKGMTSHVKHVLEYMFPKKNDTDYSVVEIFDKLAQRFVRAQTFNVDIKSCADVKPYIMHAGLIEDYDLFVTIGFLILITAVFKLLTYYNIKSLPYRMN